MKDRRSTVLFVIPSLVGGGAEHMLSHLLHHMDRRRFRMLVAVFDRKGVYLDQIPKDISLISLGKKNRFSVFGMIVKLARLYRKSRIDTVLSFMEYAGFVSLAARLIVFPKPKVIASFHNVFQYTIDHERFGKFKSLLIRFLYPRASAVVAVSEGVKKELVSIPGMDANRIHVIQNGCDLADIKRQALEPVNDGRFSKQSRNPVILTCGRLDHSKNQSLLIDAFSLVNRKFEAKLIIMGEGPERENLKARIRELGLEDRVTFLGYKKNPFKYMARSDVFVLSSETEGFAMVIIEAMACGIPVVSTQCPCGPGEIITPGDNGFLVPMRDAPGLASAISRLLEDPALRRRITAAAENRARDYDIRSTAVKYEALFKDIEDIR